MKTRLFFIGLIACALFAGCNNMMPEGKGQLRLLDDMNVAFGSIDLKFDDGKDTGWVTHSFPEIMKKDMSVDLFLDPGTYAARLPNGGYPMYFKGIKIVKGERFILNMSYISKNKYPY